MLMKEKNSIDHSSLQHGAFQFTLPHTKKGKIFWTIGAIMLLASGLLLLYSLQIPDVPPVSEAIAVGHPDDVSADDEVDLGAGWSGDSGNFITIQVIIEDGTLVHGYWTLASDGENCTDHVDAFEDAIITVVPTSGGESFSFGNEKPLSEERWRLQHACACRLERFQEQRRFLRAAAGPARRPTPPEQMRRGRLRRTAPPARSCAASCRPSEFRR